MARSRSLNNALGRLLSDSSLPIYVLDETRKIVYANPAFFQWTGTNEGRMIGVRCDYHSSPEVGPIGEMAARLCPPAEVFYGQRMSGHVACRQPSGTFSHRPVDFIPLGQNELDLVGVIAIVANIDQPQEEWSRHATSDPTPVQLHERLMALRERFVPRFGIDRLVGESDAAGHIRRQVRFAHQARARTVVFGPPGSGREHIARTIHYGDDPRKAGRLVPISCPLLDAELLQATLSNVIRHPDEGQQPLPVTLMLLDADQMPEAAQHELVDFLNLPNSDLHMLSTARHDLLQLASDGNFRQDLAAALSTMTIRLTPLAERPQDVTPLAQAILEQCNAMGGRQLTGFTPEALDQLTAYRWPGNIDELVEMVQDACHQAKATLVSAEDLPQRIRLAAVAAAYPRQEEEEIVLDDFLASVETELIRRAMQRAKGNKTKAAQLLGVTRARLHRKLEQFDPDDDS